MDAEVQQPDADAPKSGAAAADLEKIPIDQVVAALGVKRDEGLTSPEAQQRLGKYGPNAIVEKEKSFLSGLSVINSAIDEARRIFGRITSYTIYRVALTMDIMFLVVLSTIFLDFQPLTAVMIVIMSLLDDIPIMTIAYDNTPVSDRPIRWKMPRLLSISAVLGFFSVVQSFGLLLIGMEVLSDPHLQPYFGLYDQSHLQTVMFLQLVAGGHLLLFISRAERWFFLPPFPAATLFIAIVLTQILAVAMCAFGWLVPPISWTTIAWVWAYNIAWMFLLGGVRLITERLVDHRIAHRLRSAEIVNQSLQPHVPAALAPVRPQ